MRKRNGTFGRPHDVNAYARSTTAVLFDEDEDDLLIEDEDDLDPGEEDDLDADDEDDDDDFFDDDAHLSDEDEEDDDVLPVEGGGVESGLY